MDAIKEQLRKPLVMGVAGLILGILLGLLWGWGVQPVEWTDASVDLLRPDLQEDYLRMAIDSYIVNQDANLAKNRYTLLGEGGAAQLGLIKANPGLQDAQAIAAFEVTVTGGAAPAAPEGEQPAAEEKPASSSWTRVLLPLMCVVILIVAVAVYFLFFRFRRGGGPAVDEGGEPAPGRTDYEALGQEPPIAQFMSAYKLGDDRFDDSHSIDSPGGDFLGECGVGISETIGVGDPKKVTAFEVWLFDKNDIQTVTKVVMSAHAFLDEATRQRLAAKGEPVLAEVGGESVLETQSLRLTARVVDMGYGEGALPDSSFFSNMILELSVWSKTA
jgi:hypothetical protein